MLNIGRMAPGSHDYYLSVVAQGAEDYYLARGEAPGRWLGRGLDGVGLSGRVEPEQLRAVLAGDHPGSGERLAKHPARKVPGFDLTFRAPKSVSLLWALGDRDVADQVRRAHDAAVDAAVGYVEREAARTRRGAGGSERVEVDGLIAAAFRHRTSRAGDPLLHTHVLVANLVRTSDDGVWRTLESRRLFLHAKTAGYLYQAHLRHELTARLGVAWEPVTNGHADLAGIDRDVIEAFSRRRQAILDRLDERGESSARAAQVATLQTREGKEGEVSEHDLRVDWARRAELVGFDPASLADLLDRHTPQAPDVADLVGRLVGVEALTEKASTFTTRDLVQAVAQALPDGAPVRDVQATAAEVLAAAGDDVVALGVRRGRLAQVDVIRRGDGSVVPGDESEPRMTTRRLLATEQHAITTALDRRDDGLAVVPDDVADRVLAARPSLSDEQTVMVRRLTLHGDGVAVVLGRAGTGKTFALDAARDAWTRAGIPVRGVALAARAARELQDSAGIPSTTIHRLLVELDDPRPGSPLPPGSVLVVDEAGMVSTRLLARLLDHADRQHLKVVLVGDPRQLPEIDAGGLFDHLTRRLDPIELTTNRRQRHGWEVAALDELRHGDPTTALAALDQHGRITTADSAEALREQLVADWWEAFDHLDAAATVMIGLRQVDVDDLNDRARQRLHDAGLLTGPTRAAGDIEVRTGDRLLCLRNNRRIGVDNGTLATVTAITDDGGLAARTDDGRDLALPAAYVDAGQVTHGYAITGHKAQGLTVDQTFVLGSDQLYREWGYVALSRGRDTNRLYVHPAAVDPHGTAHGHQPEPDPLQQTTAGLRRSLQQAPATAYVDDRDLTALADRWRTLHLEVTPLVDRHDRLQRRRNQLAAERERVDATLAGLYDQRDQTGGALAGLRKAERERRAWLDASIAGNTHRRDDLTRQLGEVDAQLAGLEPARLAGLQAEYQHARRDLWDAIRSRLPGLEAHPPHYVLTTLGTLPDTPADRAAWRDALTQIQAYRTCWDISDPDRPLGVDPADPAQRAHRNQAMRVLLDTTRQLRRDVGLEPPAPQVRSLGISR